ncbi:g452 [Coccomyxa viridis]|uniref:G452 protein n=1 Tax=Coccomyxa viridis TaxID=1274662 RepID=A0ABP1FL32_9CHLO
MYCLFNIQGETEGGSTERKKREYCGRSAGPEVCQNQLAVRRLVSMSQTPGQDVQVAEHEPIRPEATRAHAQGLGPQAGQQILQMAGWPAPAGVDAGAAQMQALMQIIGNATPQAAMEIQRQLTAGAGPFTLQGMQGSDPGSGSGRTDQDTTGKGDDSLALTEEDLQARRVKATQEKNRRNQRKYRERQKAKISTSETEIKALTDRLEAAERLNEQLVTRNRDLEISAHLAAQAPQAQLGGEAAARQKDVHGAMARMCSQVSGEAVTEETVRLFRYRDWRKYAQVYHDRISQLFAGGADILDIKARSELASLVGIKHEAERQAWTITPLAIHRHYSLQAKLPPAYAPSTPAVKWQTIVTDLALSADQRQRLLEARQQVLPEIQRIVAERERLTTCLQVARPSLGVDSVDMLAGILTGETMDAITRNILQENHCIFLLLHTFWEIATPVQAARADHLCFPLLPDVLAMCAALSDSVADDETFGRKRAKADPTTAEEAGAAVPVPTEEQMLDTLVFKDGPSQSLYH